MNPVFKNLKNKIAGINLKDLGEMISGLGKNISESTLKRIKKAVRDKAYKDVIKESSDKGIDLTKVTADDLEFLVSDKEKELYNTFSHKVKELGLVGALAFLGIEIAGL